jgi:hypothetical protein
MKRRASVADRHNQKPPHDRSATFVSEQPPTKNTVTMALPLSSISDPASQRLIAGQTEQTPAPAPLLTPVRVTKKKAAAKAKTAPLAKTRRAAKAAKKPPAPKAKRAVARKPTLPKTEPMVEMSANANVVPNPIVLPIKDTLPSIPPIMPLPRGVAITPWRRNGAIDVIAYWLRSRARSVMGVFRRRTMNTAPSLSQASLPPILSELDQLKAENARLRQRIEQLCDRPKEGLKDA